MWTDEKVETLRDMWSKGFSASQIAAKLGGYISRSAVIGKVHRLGVQGGSRSTNAAIKIKPSPKAARPPRAAARPRARRPQPSLAGAPFSAEDRMLFDIKNNPPPPGCSDAEIVVARKTIMELGYGECRWCVEDKSNPEDSLTFFFCGAVAVEESHWCAHHKLRAETPRDRSKNYGGRQDGSAAGAEKRRAEKAFGFLGIVRVAGG